jgi:MSHA biogenesis protein MshI
MTRWPWQRKPSNDRLVVAFTPDQVSYTRSVDGRLVRCGVETRGNDSPAAFARRFRSLGLQSSQVIAVLPLNDCQLLQIDAPTVPAEEMKAAARWRIKDLVDAHLDDLTLDVMRVGDGRARHQPQMFVAAAYTRAVREISEWSSAAGLNLGAIDIRETVQRNLQTAWCSASARSTGASAALMQHGDQCLLTICANGELFYARRLAWDPSEFSDAGGRADAAPQQGGAAPISQLAMLDIVDYGAEGSLGGTPGNDDAPRLLIELQRSIDLWERSWPDLPLDRVLVQLEEYSDQVANLLRKSLALTVEVLQPEHVFADLAVKAGTPAVRSAVLPLFGVLLRAANRSF